MKRLEVWGWGEGGTSKQVCLGRQTVLRGPVDKDQCESKYISSSNYEQNVFLCFYIFMFFSTRKSTKSTNQVYKSTK